MSIYVYVLKHNPEGVYNILRKYGFSVSKDSAQNVDKLKQMVRQFGHEALIEIALIHPDRELILESESLKNKDKKLSSCGDEQLDFSKKNNADGDSEKVTKELPVKKEETTPPVSVHKSGIDKSMIFLLGGIILISAIVINSKR